MLALAVTLVCCLFSELCFWPSSTAFAWGGARSEGGCVGWLCTGGWCAPHGWWEQLICTEQ